MTSFQTVSILAPAAGATLLTGWRLRHRAGQWRRRRWQKRPPRTGAFHASGVRIAAKLLASVALFAIALAVWSTVVPELIHTNAYLAGLCGLFGLIPAYMGVRYWAGPGKLAARNLRILGGTPILTLNEAGFQYLSFAQVSWSEVHQIQYLTRKDTGNRTGPFVAVQMADAGQPLRSGAPVDIWAHERYTREVCRWVDFNAGQWMVLDLNTLAGASGEQAGYWMLVLRQQALNAPRSSQPSR